MIEEMKIMDPDLCCPCCGQHVFAEKNAYEICPVCGWEDDKVQRRDPDYAGGANKLSLNQAKAAFLKAQMAEADEDYREDEEDVSYEED